jgi:hypothetical protein
MAVNRRRTDRVTDWVTDPVTDGVTDDGVDSALSCQKLALSYAKLVRPRAAGTLKVISPELVDIMLIINNQSAHVAAPNLLLRLLSSLPRL